MHTVTTSFSIFHELHKYADVIKLQIKMLTLGDHDARGFQ